MKTTERLLHLSNATHPADGCGYRGLGLYRHYRAVITRYKFAIFVGRKPFLPGKFFEGHKRGRPMGRERGSRTGRCQGCKHLERARIERLLAAGASIKGTARKFAIDHHALRRHWINHVSLVAFTHNQNPFGLWSCWDRAANSFGARPPRQVCGRQPKSRREYPAVALEGPAELGNGPSPSPQRTCPGCAAEGPRQQ